MTNLEYVLQWLNDNVEHCKGTHEGQNEFIEDMFSVCFSYGAMETSNELKTENSEDRSDYIYKSILRGNEMFHMVTENLLSIYKIKIDENSFLAICKMLKIQGFTDAVDRIVKEEDEFAKEYLNHRMPDLNKEGNRELLQEYFKRLHDLGTFYHNPMDYKTDQERDQYYELMRIYYLLTGENN